MKIKVGDKVEFYVFSAIGIGTIVEINKDKTLKIVYGGIIYPGVQTFKALPKKKKDIPPWYILKD